MNNAPLIQTVKSLLRPLVRFCVRHALKAVEVEEMLKALFVEEARMHLQESGQEESISRLSIMTGLQRPLVATLLKAPAQTDQAEARSSLMVKVLGAWQTMPAYITADGQPRVLSSEGRDSEFAGLVRAVSQSLNPYTVLFELERAGIVERSKRGLRLTKGSLVNQRDKQQGLSFLALDVRDLVETVQVNLFEAENLKNHHLTTEFDNLSDAAAAKARALLLREGSRIHKRLRRLLSRFDRDLGGTNTGSGRKRVVFTSFGRVHALEEGTSHAE